MPPPFFTHFILVEEITTIIKIKCALAYSNKILNWMHYEWHARTQDDDEGNAVRWRLIVIYLCTYFRIQSVFWTTSNYNVWNQANVIAIIIIWLAFFCCLWFAVKLAVLTFFFSLGLWYWHTASIHLFAKRLTVRLWNGHSRNLQTSFNYY